MTYKEQLKDPRWQYVRGRVLERDNWKCKECRSIYHLQVHHKEYKAGWMAWDYPDSYLVTLCDTCHKKVHQIKEFEDGEDMDDPFVRLRHFIRDYKNLCISMAVKELEAAQKEKQEQNG